MASEAKPFGHSAATLRFGAHFVCGAPPDVAVVEAACEPGLGRRPGGGARPVRHLRTSVVPPPAGSERWSQISVPRQAASERDVKLRPEGLDTPIGALSYSNRG